MNDVIVVIPDYRNFPSTSASGMLEDVKGAFQWTLENISSYGGEDNITIMGHSAGAHLASLLLLRGVKDDNRGFVGIDRINRFIGMSGPYNPVQMEDFIHNFGFHRDWLRNKLFEGDIESFSTLKQAKQLSYAEADKLPAIELWHGQEDKTCDWRMSVDLAAALRKSGASRVSELYFAGETHTSLIIELPLSGDDGFVEYLLDILRPELRRKDRKLAPRLIFGWMARLQIWLMPF